jgi:glycosyltransferase involved in cell wall biosynthesis
MRVLHVIPSLSVKEGGPSLALPVMARALSQQGVEVTIATTDDDGRGERRAVPLRRFIKDEEGVQYIYFRKNTEFYKFSLQLTRWLLKHVSDFDLVHIHSLFSYSSVMTGFVARSRQIPYIIRPLGVLNQWGMKNRRPILKKLSLRWIELPILRSASAIHYTSRAEQVEANLAHPSIGALPSVVIPLAIEAVNQSRASAAFLAKFPEASGRPIVLFLSRLDPKKGIELLLTAFSEIRKRSPHTMLVIAGDGTPYYKASLRAKADELGLNRHVLWAGFLRDAEKEAAFAAASVFILPSFSENFGIAALEALATGVPTVLSDQVALSDDVREADAGLVVPCEAAQIATAILQLLSNPDLRNRVSANARRLAKERFSTESLTRALTDLYKRCSRARVPNKQSPVKTNHDLIG